MVFSPKALPDCDFNQGVLLVTTIFPPPPGTPSRFLPPVVIQGIDGRYLGVLLPGHVARNLITPTGHESIQYGPDLQSLTNSLKL